MADMRHIELSEREALLRAGLDDSINALCHLLKQTGKPDLDDIIRCVVTNVVPRLHAVLHGDNPMAAETSAATCRVMNCGGLRDDGSCPMGYQRSCPALWPSAAERYEEALLKIIALVPDYEESRRVADERGAEVANALTVGAWRAAEVARRALGMDGGACSAASDPTAEA